MFFVSLFWACFGGLGAAEAERRRGRGVSGRAPYAPAGGEATVPTAQGARSAGPNLFIVHFPTHHPYLGAGLLWRHNHAIDLPPQKRKTPVGRITEGLLGGEYECTCVGIQPALGRF